jgi:excisionase family DNA binding protein
MPDSLKRRKAGSSEIDSHQLTLEDWVQMLEEDTKSLQTVSGSPDHAPMHSAAPSEAQLVSAGVALLTTREVADALHVHPRTVQRLVERGELAVVRLGAAIRFDPAELVRLIAERTRIAQPSEPPPDTLRARPTGVSFAKRLRSQPA